MTPSTNTAHRYSDRGRWAPPRPRGSNVNMERNGRGPWFHFDGGTGRTARVNAPRVNDAHLFRTYSFYHSQGIIYIYDDDATEHQVGDGSEDHGARDDADEDDEDDEGDGEDGADGESNYSTADWAPLAFHWWPESSRSSFARFRGEQPRLHVRRPDQAWVDQLIPAGHVPERVLQAGRRGGGLSAELPILIALIAFSVHPNHVQQAFTTCMRHRYCPHGGRGEGCQYFLAKRLLALLLTTIGTDQRGAVVRVYYNPAEVRALAAQRQNVEEIIRPRLVNFERRYLFFT